MTTFLPLAACSTESFWKTLRDREGHPYYRISRVIHTPNQRAWGTIQVVRSLDDLDRHLFSVRITLLLGVPLAIALTGIASWWLAGLRIQQFTADAAHELRTPLASLRATIQAAVREETLSQPEIQETLQTADRQSYRLAQLVQSLLFLCQIDQQASPIDLSICELNLLLKGLIDDFEAVAIAAEVELSLDIRLTYSLHIPGNTEQLYRLISNLIMNSIQYTPAKDHVVVVLDRTQNQAVIQVQDTGIGIAAEEQAHIFDRFYRAARDGSRSKSGTGLGLAIAQAIAKSHQGSLTVQSELGKGSVFTLRLPVRLGVVL